MCCVYQRKKFTVGTVIDSVTSEDGCTSASIKCVPNGDKAKIDMRIKNDCPKPASEDTLSHIVTYSKEHIIINIG